MSERKVYTGKLGKTYTAPDPPLGQGGEGAVFKIQEDTSKVIKVFWEENRTPEREKKLVAMTDMHLPDNLTTQNTWPVDLVYENDTFAGFVMKAVTNSIPVNRLYMDDYKKRCTYDKRVFIAKNICAAVHSVHIAGQVVGDLNPKNVCVNPDTGMVTLVDTNSYHITDPKTGEVHRCEVGLPEYLAKEIQLTLRKGTTLKDAPLPTFTKETDNFALAVHIFALLMNGCHPYACARDMGADIDSLSKNKSSVTMPQPIDNICTGNFTFDNPAKGTKPPLYAPYYGMLPDNIRQLFKRAFVTGSDDPKARPDAVEWFKALDGLLHSLKKCKTDATHIFPANAGTCPWCQLNSGKQIPPTPESTEGGDANSSSTGTTGTENDLPLTYDELKVLGDSIEANVGGKKNIKSVSRDRNCVILELKKKEKNLAAFADESVSSITEDGNSVKYCFYDEGNAEGIELYINNKINKPGNSDKGSGKRNKIKNKTGKKSKKWLIPIVIAAAVAAPIIILFVSGVFNKSEVVLYFHTYDYEARENYSTNNGENIQNIKVKSGDIAVVPNAGLIKEGYKFEGWNSLPNRTTAEFIPGDEIKMNETLELYPAWSPDN